MKAEQILEEIHSHLVTVAFGDDHVDLTLSMEREDWQRLNDAICEAVGCQNQS